MKKIQQPRKYNNGKRYRPAVKIKARELRKNGRSFKEIAQALGISKATAYLWTSDIRLTAEQHASLQKRQGTLTHRWSPEERKIIGLRLRPYQFKSRNSPESLLKEIKDFYQVNGRIPLKHEFNSRSAFRKYFGTWNNAIRAAGFTPNPVLFAERVVANDKHICDSVSEKVIDDWLSTNNIPHQRHAHYPKSKMTADFYLPQFDTYIEFFGLQGGSRKYDRSYKRKLELIQKYKLKVIALYSDDIYKSTYKVKLKFLLSDIQT